MKKKKISDSDFYVPELWPQIMISTSSYFPHSAWKYYQPAVQVIQSAKSEMFVLFSFFEVLNDDLIIKDYNCYGFGQYEKDN